MIESAFYTFIKLQTGITALIGNRIYPDTAPDSVLLPCLVFEKTGVDRQLTLLKSSGVVTATLQLDIFANSRLAAETIVESIRLAFDGYQGTWDTTNIFMARLDNESVGWEIESATETGTHRATVDLIVTFSESVTTFT
jgi:hypothetical protein